MKLKYFFIRIFAISITLTLITSCSKQDDIKLYTCFTPGENCTENIVNLIKQAKTSIFIQASIFSSEPIINAIIAAKERNVNIKILFDKSLWTAHNTTAAMLLEQEIPISLDKKVLLAHNNVIIIDHRQVITGSFTFTREAQEKNAENLLIIDNSNIAKRYEDNWQSRAVLSETVTELPKIEKAKLADNRRKYRKAAHVNKKPKNSGVWPFNLFG